jgi:hypothetical protein
MPLTRLSAKDGTWDGLKQAWRAECEKFGEDFDNYALGTFAILDPLALEHSKKAGIFGLPDGGSISALCQANCTPLPGHPKPVLRVRFMTFSPRFDFGDLEVTDYARVLVGMFFGIIALSQRVMAAKEVKFHLRSLADRQFFAALETPLSKVSSFKRVEVQGMWLYVTKS